MFDQLLPRSLDNRYRGHRAALWLLGLVAGVKIVQSLSVIVNGYGTAVAADGIPLDIYPRGAAKEMVALFAQVLLRRVAAVPERCSLYAPAAPAELSGRPANLHIRPADPTGTRRGRT